MRYWRNQHNEDASIHCLGNGRLIAYEMGPNIEEIFGPPYSSVSSIRLCVDDFSPIEARSEREIGSAIWKHDIYREDHHTGSLIDFIDSQLPVFIRKLDLTENIKFTLEIASSSKILENNHRFEPFGSKAAILSTVQRGAYVFMQYPSPIQFNYQIVLTGEGILIKNDDNRWIVSCNPGNSTLYIIGGPSFPECMTNAESVLTLPYEELKQRTQKYWQTFSKRRNDFQTLLPTNAPNRELILKTIDDLAVLIKTQQGIEGGVLAGKFYHWAALRDQYGVFRCLLALGYFEEAKAILQYYWDIYQKRGILHNGQDIGLDGFFHIHENDNVEITGYLLVQAFNYLDVTHDDAFIQEILPMLTWALKAQTKHIIKNMLPFNGDETYVAGGILPRSVLNDGSAESTLLFLTGGTRLIEWVGKNCLWSEAECSPYNGILKETRANYRNNFWRDGKILTNNPTRVSIQEMPRFRHGVCEAGRYDKTGLRCQGGTIGWVEKTEDGRYLCPTCYAGQKQLPNEQAIFYLQSVSLVPLYIGSDLFTKEEITGMVELILDNYRITGQLPSSPSGTLTVGYDYGYLLYTLCETRHPMAKEIYLKMLSVLDSTGAWVEYYKNDQPKGCPCRPWESGINLEAALYYLRTI